MDWQAIRFDWTQLRGFLATAEEGSLSAAARALKLTQPTLGRQVAALEEALGVVLFERVGRGLVLTPAGQELLPHARAMGDAAGRISLAAAGQAQGLEGKVRITASDVFSAHLLPPILSQLRSAAHKLQIEVVAANDIRDILRREADIAIRHVRPTEPDLIARMVRQDKGHFYAAPAYIRRHGRPETLSDLARHEFISFGDAQQMMAYLNPLGMALREGNFPIGSASGVVAWKMAREGLGIIVMVDDVAEQTPEMERLLPGMAPFEVPVWLVTHRELHSSARIRLVYDLLAGALARGS
ncbi:LysR family transcriptional regulator [Rhodobacteraceae bacterium D3-12]|nr:LysR family transcriptional regulator [Rhodobacteraceae bacterium D3-12]